MKTIFRNAGLALFLSSSLVVSAVSQSNGPSAQPDYTVVSAVPYVRGAGGPLLADFYVPNGRGPFPGVLFIHGGGWTGGTRNQMVRLIKALAEQGYVGMTIEYDVVPNHFPVALNESLDAVEFFRHNAARFKLDPKRIAVAGSSAGGELAALVALSPWKREGSGNTSIPPVQAAVILNGVLDLHGQQEHTGRLATRYLGGDCSALPSACDDASPVSHVHSGAPAFYVGHGTADQTVPFAQAEAFTASLRKAKVPVEFYIATDGPHTYWSKERYFDENLKNILQFLSGSLARHPHNRTAILHAVEKQPETK